MNELGLYVIITKPVLDYETIAKVCVDNNIKMLQLREKHLNDKEVLSASEQILKITRGTGTKYIINDRADLALFADADGVHLGQDDISFEQARQLLPNKIIGLSTHSILQAKEALAKNPDYIGFGPVYPTPTKAIADPAVGTDLLNEVLSFSKVPVVAIGGIDDTNLDTVLQTGAKTLSVVRYIMNHKDLEQRIQFIQKKLLIRRALFCKN
jgi:thiamine-phosphate pyrophosphorylase